LETFLLAPQGLQQLDCADNKGVFESYQQFIDSLLTLFYFRFGVHFPENLREFGSVTSSGSIGLVG
jgi:hypothetical protein